MISAESKQEGNEKNAAKTNASFCRCGRLCSVGCVCGEHDLLCIGSFREEKSKTPDKLVPHGYARGDARGDDHSDNCDNHMSDTAGKRNFLSQLKKNMKVIV